MSDFNDLDAIFDAKATAKQRQEQEQREREEAAQRQRDADFHELMGKVVAPMQKAQEYLRTKGVSAVIRQPRQESTVNLEAAFELPMISTGYKASLSFHKLGDVWNIVMYQSKHRGGHLVQGGGPLGQMDTLPDAAWVTQKLKELMANEAQLGMMQGM